MTEPLLEMSLIAKVGGALTKRIALSDAGVESDSGACFLMTGTASRLKLRDVGDLAEQIQRFEPRHALTLGGLRPDLPEHVTLRVKRELNGQEPPDIIARTGENFVYRPGYPALVLLDHDTKGMPPEIADRMRSLGGFEAALRSTVLPELGSVARLTRASTSAGLYRTDTGERLPASNGVHLYLMIRNGTDVERFLKTLHVRLWLTGFGWLMIGIGGQVLERSIVDRMVGGAERLVFEGPPILLPPLAQDAEARKPIAFDGDALNTFAVCPPPTIVEQSAYRTALARAKDALAPDIAAARASFVAEQAERLATR